MLSIIRLFFCVLCLSFSASSESASQPHYRSIAAVPQVSATRLHRMCEYYSRVLRGADTNYDAARQCEMYIRAFLDSSRIYATLSGVRLFCMRGAQKPADVLPALNLWIRKHPNKADKATAAVALADALRVAYPCGSYG